MKSKHQNRPSVHAQSLELLENRAYMAAHIVGSSTNFSTIQAAVNAAVAGNTITVDAGTYNETVTINKTLTLKGAKAGIDARTRSTTGETIVSNVNGAFRINAKDVILDGFTVQGETNQSGTTGAGVVMAPTVAGTQLRNNVIQNNVAGVFLANSSATDACLIQNNLFKNNNNAGVDGGRGIYTDGGLTNGFLTNVIIDSNTFTGNRGSTGTTTLESAVAFEAQSATSVQSNLRITNNTFTSNGKSLLFFNSTNVTIQGNTASGILDWYSGCFRFEGNNHNVNISYNNILNNSGPGVAVDSNGVPGDNSGFVVNFNNITNNATNYKVRIGVVYNQSVYDGGFDARNNYWGSSTGPSGDGPGTGDGVYGNAYKTGNWIVAKGGSELFSPWSATSNSTTIPSLPSAPSNLAAVINSTTQVTLTWAGGANATGIKVERSLDQNNWTPLDTVLGNTTSYLDNTVSAGVTYFYRVRATNSVGDSANSNVAIANVPASTLPSTYLSDINWSSATVGYGTIQKDHSIAGNTLSLGNKTYAKGIGTHASSTIIYQLGGAYSTFQSDIGIDAEEDVKGTGHVEFVVIGDGKTLYDSGVIVNDNVKTVTVDVSGVKTLTLQALPGVSGSIDYDHADWAGATLYGANTVPSAPSNLLATPVSASSIGLTWTAGSANLTSYAIDRSTDGTNFSVLASNVSASATSYLDSTITSMTQKYYYRVRAVNAAGSSAPSNVSSTNTSQLTNITYLSDLIWTDATTGYGTINKDASVGGNVITLNGTTYTKGIGAHAISNISYNLAGNYSTFQSDVGVDQEEDNKGEGRVIFQVYGDGKLLFDSGALTNDQVGHVSVDVSGVQTLTLVATNGVANSIDYDHADWAGARLTA
jgi:hypothetical protein